MKKHLILGMLCLAIPACLPENKTGTVAIKPSVNPSTMASVLVSPSPAPIPSPTTKTYETVENNGGRCLNIDFEQVKPALKYPVDLAVSPDGSKLYILNKRCGDLRSTRPRLNEEPFLFDDCPPYSKINQSDPRGYIYEFDTADKKLKLLTIAGKPPLSCEIGEDIEIDSQGRLYVNTPGNHRIYRIDIQKQQVEQILEALNYHDGDRSASPAPSQRPLLDGPAYLYLDQDTVYYSMAAEQVNTPERIYKHNENGTTELLLNDNGAGGSNSFPKFAVYKGLLNLNSWAQIFPPFPVNSPEDYRWVSFTADPNPQLNGSSLLHRFDSLGQLFSTGTYHVVLKNTFLSQQKAHTSIFAGSGLPGLQDGVKQNAQFKFPMGLAIDANNNLYVADTGNHAIRKITPDGTVTTLYKEPDPHGG